MSSTLPPPFSHALMAALNDTTWGSWHSMTQLKVGCRVWQRMADVTSFFVTSFWMRSPEPFNWLRLRASSKKKTCYARPIPAKEPHLNGCQVALARSFGLPRICCSKCKAHCHWPFFSQALMTWVIGGTSLQTLKMLLDFNILIYLTLILLRKGSLNSLTA